MNVHLLAGLLPLAGLFSTAAEPNPPAPVAPLVRACDADSYWGVSTRDCPQSLRTGIEHCPLQFRRCHANGCCRSSSEVEFLASLQPGVPVCFMAHGSFVKSIQATHDAGRTCRWLRSGAPDRPLQFVFFEWPSDRCLSVAPLIDIELLGRQASRNAFPLARLIAKLPPETPVCLIGHSHGARLIAATAHLLAGGCVQGHRLRYTDNIHRIRLVVAAAAFDHNWLNPGERFDRTLCRVESLVNLRNRHDFALCAYPFRKPLGSRAFGQTGLTAKDRTRLGSRSRRVSQIDLTSTIKTRHVWPNYTQQRWLARAIRRSVHFTDTPPVAATQDSEMPRGVVTGSTGRATARVFESTIGGEDSRTLGNRLLIAETALSTAPNRTGLHRHLDTADLGE